MGNHSAVQSYLMQVKKERGCSVAELARICDLHPRTMENCFKGRNPSATAIVAICKGLGISADQLLGLVDVIDLPSERNAIAAGYCVEVARLALSACELFDNGDVEGARQQLERVVECLRAIYPSDA